MPKVDDLLSATRASHVRFLAALEGLDERALTLRTSSGWTVAGTLAHLAFYDDWVIERWRRWLTAGHFQHLPDDITELANAAGERGWLAVSPHRAQTIAREAAAAVTQLLDELPPAALDDAVATNRLAMLDRSRHWEPHLDEVQRALT